MKQILLFVILVFISVVAIGQVTDGLVAHISFSNSTNPDVGSFTPTATNMAYGPNRFGDANAALAFSGFDSNQSYGWTDSIISLATDHALTYWFKSDGGSTDLEYLVTSRQGLSGAEQGGLDGSIISPSRKVTVQYRLISSSPIATLSTSENAVVNGTWHHLAIVRSGAIVSLFFDGVLADSDTITQSAKTSQYWSVGSAVNNVGILREIDGNIDDIKFYDRALTVSEVDTLANDIQIGSTGIASAWFSTVENQVKIYPNPAASQFTVQMLGIEKNATIEIFDLTGRMVHQQNMVGRKNEVMLDAGLKGVFLVKILSEGTPISVNRVVIY